MKRIYVIKERWVIIGEVVSATSKAIKLADAAVIRVWGTTKGLGQIALEGPTPETKLDPCGTVELPTEAVLFSIECRV